jgi:hypothetical protein
MHVPPLQNGVVPLQTWPQVPQLFLSLDVSMHDVPHAVRPAPQLVPHDPPLHTVPVAQVRPQNPQLLPSLLRSSQTPLQLVSPAKHAHVPPEQYCPAAHALLHLPQFAGSLLRNLQTPPQSVPVDPQSSTHALPWQCMLFDVSQV